MLDSHLGRPPPCRSPADQHGRWPTSADWNAAGDDHPAKTAVIVRFGTWNAGVAAVRDSGSEPEGPAAASAEATLAPPAADTAVASPDPPARAEVGSLPEPPSEPDDDEPPLPAAAAPPADTGASGSEAYVFQILDLITLIRDLDRDDGCHIEVMRWDHEGSGETDEAATALVRRLVRVALDAAPLDAIGAAVLAQLDGTAG